MALHEHLRRGFELLGLSQLRPRATALLGRIARELDAVDRKHLAANQALSIADRDHRREDMRDLVPDRAHEVRDGGEMRGLIPAQCNERHVLRTGPRNRPATHDPAGVCKQHDLQQHGRRVGRRPGVIVPEPRIERRQIQRVIEQVVQRVFECPGQELPRQVNGQELGIGVDILLTGHAGLDGEGSTAQIRGTELSKARARIRRGADLFLQPR
jgi:hypothetical protein